MAEPHAQDLLPAFALGALDEPERQVVAAHLAACPTCAAELRAYQQTVDQLALAVAQHEPPARLRQAVLDRARATSGQRVTHSAQVDPVLPPAPRGLLAALAGFFSARPAWALVGLALILFLTAGNLILYRQVVDLRQQRNTFSLVRLNPAPVAASATGLIIVSPGGDYGALIVDSLPELGKDRQYQLWLSRAGQRVSGGVFSVYGSGYGVLRVTAPEPLSSYESFGITVEPTGGSPAPTGERVMGG